MITTNSWRKKTHQVVRQTRVNPRRSPGKLLVKISAPRYVFSRRLREKLTTIRYTLASCLQDRRPQSDFKPMDLPQHLNHAFLSSNPLLHVPRHKHHTYGVFQGVSGQSSYFE
jgi:hypothetical protein